MITCARCGSSYEDDASYCNLCQMTLEESNSHYLIDQKKLLDRMRVSAIHTRRLIYTLVVIGVTFPFYAASRFFPNIIFGSQRIVWTLLILVSIITSIITLKNKHPRSSWACTAVVLLLLPILPLGTLGAALVLFFWLSRK